MNILMIADFRNDHPRLLSNNSRKFAKGFLRNGHDVLSFSYREVMEQQSPLKGKSLSRLLAKDKTDRLLATLARHHQSDLVFITTYKLFDAHSLQLLKQTLPRARFVFWYGDMRPGLDPRVVEIGRACELFLATSSGHVLRAYRAAGIPRAGFLPNTCDPDLEHPYVDIPASFRVPIAFIGKLLHGHDGQDPDRERIIQRLVAEKGMKTYGCQGGPRVDGLDFLHAAAGADLALSINAYNDVRLYHSDRLVIMLACGPMVLAKRVPDSDLLFQDGEHLRYFDTAEECLELADFYLRHPADRLRIAQAGCAYAHAHYHPQRLAKCLLDLLETGATPEPWCEVI